MKLVFATIGTVVLMSSFSNAWAQDPGIFVHGQRHTQHTTDYNPYVNDPWQLGYDEKCGPDVDEDCYDDSDFDDYDPNDPYGIGAENPQDQVVTTAQIRRRFNLTAFLLERLASNFSDVNGFTSNDEWFLDQGILPVPYTFYVSLLEAIEQSINQMLVNMRGELNPQLIALGVLSPADASAIAAQIGGIKGAINDLTEQVRQISGTVNTNSADIEALQATLNATLASLDSTISLLANIQNGIDHNDPTFAQLGGAISDLHRTRDAVAALSLMGVFGN